MRFVQGPLPQAGAVFLACVSLGGCPSFSQVGPARSHGVPLLWTWCACGLPVFPPPVFSFGMWSSLLIANESLQYWLLLSVFANPFLLAYCGTPTSSFGWSALLVAGSHTLVWLVANLCQWAPSLASAAVSLCGLGVLTGCPCGCASTVCWAVGFPGLLASPSLSSLL